MHVSEVIVYPELVLALALPLRGVVAPDYRISLTLPRCAYISGPVHTHLRPYYTLERLRVNYDPKTPEAFFGLFLRTRADPLTLQPVSRHRISIRSTVFGEVISCHMVYIYMSKVSCRGFLNVNLLCSSLQPLLVASESNTVSSVHAASSCCHKKRKKACCTFFARVS